MSPKIVPAEAGTVELVSSVRLANGKRLRDAIKMDASSLAPFADHLLHWFENRLSTSIYTVGDDILKFRAGGTDWLPKVILFNQGPNGGSLSLVRDDIPSLVETVRAYVARNERTP